MLFQYILKRLLATIPVLLAVSTIVFFLIHAIPGDPVDLIIGEQALAADRDAIAKQLHLSGVSLRPDAKYRTFMEVERK